MARTAKPTREIIQNVVDKNYAAFRKQLPTLLATHQGQFALLRDEQIIDFFGTATEAAAYAQSNFDDDLYSVQEVTDTAIDLGWFSHAVH
ncbi:MAG: hypothetical protein OXF11_05315 [Deltaproteobacteria bacterium]|nr:hypothetical protein [Deltaproteobacteria bacterium]